MRGVFILTDNNLRIIIKNDRIVRLLIFLHLYKSIKLKSDLCRIRKGDFMAIIAISRQVAALGDEVADAVSKKMGYKFINRQEMEKRIVELGFPAEKLKKYDERKPGFFASLVKDRDEYLNYLQTAILEAASQDNCVLIGRGAFLILENLPNLISLRFVAKNEIRVERLKKEFNWTEKQALQRISESDTNRRGFHKSFFNVEIDDSSHFLMVMNTGVFTADSASELICGMVKNFIDPEKEAAGKERLTELLKCQHLVNKLVFEHHLAIEFLRAVVKDGGVVLQGVTNSAVIVERALHIASEALPEYSVSSAISVVQDFKARM